MNQKNSEAILAEADAQLKGIYKVKDIVVKHLAAGNPFAAASELNVYFRTMFRPDLFTFQKDKEELLKQANKLLAKSEFYTWPAFQKNVFPGIGVALNDSVESRNRLDEGFRTLYLLMKNGANIPPFLVKHLRITEEVCTLYTAHVRKMLFREFGDQVNMVFNQDGTIYDAKLYQQMIDFIGKHTSPNLMKDTIEQKQLPSVLVEIALKGQKAFPFVTMEVEVK